MRVGYQRRGAQTRLKTVSCAKRSADSSLYLLLLFLPHQPRPSRRLETRTEKRRDYRPITHPL